MSLIIKPPASAFTKPMPKLYRDAVVNTGTRYAYDALNTASYPKQAAPANGNPSADKWVNLVDGTANGNLYSPAGEITWSAQGGFVSTAASASDKIAALNNVTPAAETKCLGIVWVKHTSSGSNNDLIANFGDMVTISHANAVNGAIPANRFYAGSSGSPIQEFTGIGDTTAKVGTVFQLAAAFENVSRSLTLYVNGQLAATRAGFQDIQAPTRPHTLMQATGFGTSYVGTFRRWIFDSLSGGKTAAEIVALDYSLNAARLAV